MRSLRVAASTLLAVALLAGAPAASLSADLDREPVKSAVELAALETQLVDSLLADEHLFERYSHYAIRRDPILRILISRFGCLRSNASGNADRGWGLDDDIWILLNGPPNDTHWMLDHYIITSSCRQHSCDEKGLMIADTRTKRLSFAILHYFPWTDVMQQIERPIGGHGDFLSLFVPLGTKPNTLSEIRLVARNWVRNEAPNTRPVPEPKIYASSCATQP